MIALVVLWRLRYKLALRDLPEMFLIRGIVFSHEAVRDWEAKLTPALAESFRRRRRGKVGKSWYVDETYIKVHGLWRYLYRAIDRNGALVDVMFSEDRDMAAAKAFFASAKMVTGVTPDRVTTDGRDSYPRAIRTVLGTSVRHRDSQYLNNRLEQDHRGRQRPLRPDARIQVLTIGWRLLSCLRRVTQLPPFSLPNQPARHRRLPQVPLPASNRNGFESVGSRLRYLAFIEPAILAGTSADRTPTLRSVSVVSGQLVADWATC
jgi:transposase-like protein